MASISGGLGDILSLALKKTGVSSAHSPQQLTHGEPSSVLNEAAGAINNSLLSSDLNTLTEGLFSDLASVKGPSISQNSTNAETIPESVVPSVASPLLNGTVQVHTPTTNVAKPLSMPVLVKLPSSTPERYQQSTSYAQNSVQYRPVSTQAAASATTPIISVSGSFSDVSGGTQPIASGFVGQGEAPSLTTNSNQAPQVQATTDAGQYDYSSVLHGDNLDLDGLDEFLAADPMDIPPTQPLPPPAPPVYQNQQLPPAYSSQHVPSPMAINNTNQASYSLSGVPNQTPGLLNNSSGSPGVSLYTAPQQQYQQQQPQAMTPQYGVQQPMMTQSYQSPGSVLSSPQPHAHQMVPTRASSVNTATAGHFQASVPMATDLSNIMPSTSSILPASATNGGALEMPSLSEADIHNILDLDDSLDFDLDQFNLDSSMTTSDPFASFGMNSGDLTQPSNMVHFNGSSLVNSSMGSAVNAPPMSYGSTVQPTRPAYSTALQQQQQQQVASMRSRFNLHSNLGRGGQTTKMNIPRARVTGMGRGAGIPMPPQAVVSDMTVTILSTEN